VGDKGDNEKLRQMFDAAAQALREGQGGQSALNQAVLQIHWLVCKVYTLLFNAMKKSRLSSIENPLTNDWQMEEESSLLRQMEASNSADVIEWDHKMLDRAYRWIRLKLVEQEALLDPVRGSTLHTAGSLPFPHQMRPPGASSMMAAQPQLDAVRGLSGGGQGSVVDALNLLRTVIDSDSGSAQAEGDIEARAEFLTMLQRRMGDLQGKLRSRMEVEPAVRRHHDAPQVSHGPRPTSGFNSTPKQRQDGLATPKKDILFDPLAPTSNIWTHSRAPERHSGKSELGSTMRRKDSGSLSSLGSSSIGGTGLPRRPATSHGLIGGIGGQQLSPPKAPLDDEGAGKGNLSKPIVFSRGRLGSVGPRASTPNTGVRGALPQVVGHRR